AVGQAADRRLAPGLDFQEIDDVLHPLAVGDFLAFGRAQPQRLGQHAGLHAQVAARHDVVQHAHALEQGQVLEGARNAHFGGAARIHPGELLFLQQDAAFLGRIDAVDDVQHRALAGAVGADDGADLVLAHVEGYVRQRLDPAEGQGNVLQVEDDIADPSGPGRFRGLFHRQFRHSGHLLQWFGPHHGRGFDAQVGGNAARAAVLELDLGLDELARTALEQGLDQHGVFLRDEGAANLAGAGQLVVVRVQFLVQDQEAADLRGRQLRILGEIGVDLLDAIPDQGVDPVLAGQVGVAGIGQAAALGPVADRFQVDVDEGADLGAIGPEGDGFLDEGEELQLVLDVLGREQAAIGQVADVL